MRKVLLAVDGSTASHEAARLISRLPHPEPMDLTIISVVQYPSVQASFVTAELLRKAYEQDKAFANETFREISAMFDGANASVRHQFKEGNVGEAIVETAQEIQADLVVVGAKGRSQISRILLGSISDHVATHAPCSVLVVRSTGLSDSLKPIHLCLAYEGSGPAQAALKEIAEVPWRNGADFHVLSVASDMYDVFGNLREDIDIARQYRADLMQAKEQLFEAAPNAITHLIEREHVGEGIVGFAEENKVDLLVVGETPRNVLNRFLMGSTARYVLRHAPCSVWIARNRMIHDFNRSDKKHQLASG